MASGFTVGGARRQMPETTGLPKLPQMQPAAPQPQPSATAYRAKAGGASPLAGQSRVPGIGSKKLGGQVVDPFSGRVGGGGGTVGKLGAAATGTQGGAGGFPGMPDFGSLGDFAGGGGAGGGSIGGGGGGGDVDIPGFDPLSIKAAPSPEMAAETEAWKARMAAIKSGQEARMSSDTTQRATDRAIGSIKSQAAGANERATEAGSAMGRGAGYGAGGISDAAIAAGGKAAADIALGRERDLDSLFATGEGLQNQAFGMNPYGETANLALGQQRLGLDAYTANLEAKSRAAETAARIQEARARMYGTPFQWYSMLLGA